MPDKRLPRPYRSPQKSAAKQQGNGGLTPVGHQAEKVQLRLFPIKEVEVDGVPMGVLSDGTPYLHLRGLARMCGVDHAALLRLANNWDEEQTKPRGLKIKEFLAAHGHCGESLNLQTESSGIDTHVYIDAVCMAILEYYAFEATQGSNETARRNYRELARYSFRKFIYKTCGYDPDRHIPDSWRNFRERVLLNDQIPVGYFCIFREIADLVVHMIRAGCPLDSHTVPDISVGRTWAKHWTESTFDAAYGDRLQHPHVFPEWFPQAAANPVPVWIYPATALGTFHIWLHRYYIPQQFPKYVAGKVEDGVFLPARADHLIEAVSRKELPPAK